MQLLYGYAERSAVIIRAHLLSYVWVMVNGLLAIIIQLEVQGLVFSFLYPSFFGDPAAFTY